MEVAPLPVPVPMPRAARGEDVVILPSGGTSLPAERGALLAEGIGASTNLESTAKAPPELSGH